MGTEVEGVKRKMEIGQIQSPMPMCCPPEGLHVSFPFRLLFVLEQEVGLLTSLLLSCPGSSQL